MKAFVWEITKNHEQVSESLFDWRIQLESGATGCHTCLQSFGVFGNCLRINHTGVKVGALFFIPEIDSYSTRGTNSLYGSSMRFSWSTIIGQINSNWCQNFGTNIYLSCTHNCKIIVLMWRQNNVQPKPTQNWSAGSVLKVEVKIFPASKTHELRKNLQCRSRLKQMCITEECGNQQSTCKYARPFSTSLFTWW